MTAPGPDEGRPRFADKPTSCGASPTTRRLACSRRSRRTARRSAPIASRCSTAITRTTSRSRSPEPAASARRTTSCCARATAEDPLTAPGQGGAAVVLRRARPRRAARRSRTRASVSPRASTACRPGRTRSSAGRRSTAFYVRQIADHQAYRSRGPAGSTLVEYSRVCGETFAKAHARTAIRRAVGLRRPRREARRALAARAIAGADQVTADHAILVKAIADGTIKAAELDEKRELIGVTDRRARERSR